MNRIKLLVLSIMGIMLSSIFQINAGAFVHLAKQDKPEQHHVQVSATDKQLQTLEKEKNELLTEDIKPTVEEITARLSEIKERIKQPRTGRRTEFLTKMQSILNTTYQIVTEIDQERDQIKNIIDQTAKLLNEYKADPEFEKLRVAEKAAPDFDDLQELLQRIRDANARSVELGKTKLSLSPDINKRKKAVAVLQEQYQAKKNEQEAFSTQKEEEVNGLNHKEQGQILDEQLRQFKYKVELAQLKVKEAELRLSLIDTQLMIIREQINVFKSDSTRIKRALNIDTNYVKSAETALEAKRQTLVEKTDRAHEKIRLLIPTKEDLKNKIDELKEKYSTTVPDITAFEDWNKEPKTVNEWTVVSELAAFITEEEYLDAERDYIESQVEFEKAKFRQDEVRVETIRSWHKMTQRKFRFNNEEEINQEIKAYQIMQAELQVDLAALTDKRNSSINLLHSLNVSLDRIKVLSGQLKNQKNYIFRDKSSVYTKALEKLYKAEEQIRKRIDYTAKIIESYSTTIATMSDTIKKIEDVVAELGSKGFWRRSSQSIDWGELRNFFPDIKRFIYDVRVAGITYFAPSHLWSMTINGLKQLASVPVVALLLLRILMVIIIFWLLRLYLPDFRNHLLQIGPEYGALSTLSIFVGTCVDFAVHYLPSFYAWLVIFLSIKFGYIHDAYFSILFYLFSMVYMLFLTYRFINYLLLVNRRRNNIFISASFAHRFKWIIVPIAYATVFIFFLREAFVMGNYQSSHVPTILLAINFILLQVAIFSLFSKEQVLSIIPTDTPLWEWIEEHVNKYYYALLLIVTGIIIMSNPYVGYGRQVIYVLSRLIFTILLIPLFSWLHNRLKKGSSDLFFYYTDGETVKERFSAAKSWYGFFVVATFVVFCILGFAIGARAWGHPISLYEIKSWLSYRLYSPGLDEITGKAIEVTGLSLLKIVIFVLAGIALTYVINHFVLRRIFDPLLVGSGVQNTILTLTRYAIILIALLIGLQSAGLDAMTTKLGILIGLLSYYIKEPVFDFFSYFIILVQRPIKIGDLVMLDKDTMGVVRQITPRATIVRRRNSVTLVVPNSHIITKTVVNWNYTRTFFAFDDILVTVGYQHDPKQVKQIIHKVLDENPYILKNPASIVWLSDFVENGYQFLVRGYLTADKVLDQWEISSNVRLEIVRQLRDLGIEVASPIRTIRFLQQPGQLQQHLPDLI